MKRGKFFGTGIEEIILITLIYLNIIEFFEVIPPVLNYTKKIISWIALGTLLYHASPTKIFFGQKNKSLDITLILTYFLFVTKNLVSYSKIAHEMSRGSLRNFYQFILNNSLFFENTLIKIGLILLVFLSLFMTFKLEVKAPSTLNIIHNSGKIKKDIIHILTRFISILFVIFGFFFIVFNLMMEWLAMAIDAPLLMVGIGAYFIFAIRYKHLIKTSKIIFNLGNMGEHFYEKFVELFQSKKIYLGIIGMLVLHLLTDIGTFIIPYLTSLHNELYFEQFSRIHYPLIYLFNIEKTALTLTQIPQLLIIYILNVLGLLFFLTIPAIIWKKLSDNSTIKIPKIISVLFYTSIPIFFFTPLFSIQKLGETSLRGIDILTKRIIQNTNYSLESVLILGLILGIISLIITNTKKRPLLDLLTFFITSGFFGWYLFLYSTDLISYYIESLNFLIGYSEYLLVIFMGLSIFYTIIFYLGGFLLYLYNSLFQK